MHNIYQYKQCQKEKKRLLKSKFIHKFNKKNDIDLSVNLSYLFYLFIAKKMLIIKAYVYIGF